MIDKLENLRLSIIDDIDRYHRITDNEAKESINYIINNQYIVFDYKVQKNNTDLCRRLREVLSLVPISFMIIEDKKYYFYTSNNFEIAVTHMLRLELSAVELDINFHKYCASLAKEFGTFLNMRDAT
jgi:hypothetical protein